MSFMVASKGEQSMLIQVQTFNRILYFQLNLKLKGRISSNFKHGSIKNAK